MTMKRSKVECTVRIIMKPGGPHLEAPGLIDLFEYEYDELTTFWFGVADLVAPQQLADEIGESVGMAAGAFVTFADGRMGAAKAISSRGDHDAHKPVAHRPVCQVPIGGIGQMRIGGR